MNLPEKRDRNTVSFDMKVELAEKFRMAGPEVLAEIVKVVEGHSKNSMEKHGSKFIQIKFEGMDRLLFDKLSGYWTYRMLEEQPKLKKIKLIDANDAKS